MSKKVAILTCQDVSHYDCIDDDLFIDILKDHQDVNITVLPWDKKGIDWNQFDLVVIRTTWDYIHRIDEFIPRLEEISQATKLINPIETIKWNYNKKYLLDLPKKGFVTIPTIFKEKITQEEIEKLLQTENYEDGLIIKPCIGASSNGIQFIQNAEDFKEIKTGEWFIQPFQPTIKTEGEFSLFVFDGKYSHGVNKKPKSGEFRSQEEFGSQITDYKASAKLQQQCLDIVKSLPIPVHYARLDFILDKNNTHQIIELELIEPCLFLKYDSNAAKNFADLILRQLEA